jgi:hypothetical protein
MKPARKMGDSHDELRNQIKGRRSPVAVTLALRPDLRFAKGDRLGEL